jgi:hypothetical protein
VPDCACAWQAAPANGHLILPKLLVSTSAPNGQTPSGQFTRRDVSGSRLLRNVEVHTTIFRAIIRFELATFKSGSLQASTPSRPQNFHRRMRGGSTVLDHELGEYPFEMLRDSTDFGGEDNRDLGVAFSLAQPEKDLRFAAS